MVSWFHQFPAVDNMYTRPYPQVLILISTMPYQLIPSMTISPSGGRTSTCKPNRLVGYERASKEDGFALCFVCYVLAFMNQWKKHIGNSREERRMVSSH